MLGLVYSHSECQLEKHYPIPTQSKRKILIVMLLANVSLMLLAMVENSNITQCNDCLEQAQFDILNKIIGKSNKHKAIETIVYFGDKNAIEHYIAPIMSGIPKVIITQAYKLKIRLSNNFSTKLLFLAFGTLNGKLKWRFISKALDSMQRHVRGIFVAPYQRNPTFLEHFQWCWLNGFLNVIALIEPQNVGRNKSLQAPFHLLTYNPFPNVKVTKISLDSIGKKRFFSNIISDFRGYKVRTAVQYDPPRVFRVRTSSRFDRQNFIGGYATRTFREFLKYHNALLEIVPQSNSSAGNIMTAIEQLKQGEADLSTNIYFDFPGVRISYPLTMTKWCIMLPSAGVIPAYAYFLRPFQQNTWFAFAAMLMFLSFTSAFNEFIISKAKRRRANFAFGRAFSETLRLLLWLSTPPAYRHFKLHYAFNYTLLALFGFMLSNYYLALMTSFRASVIFKPQVNTMQEIVDRNISINVIEFEIPLVLKNQGLPKGFVDLLIPRKFNEMSIDVLRMRAGRAYLLREDTIQFVMVQQKDDVIMKFHVAEECIATVPTGFLMPSHSQFKGSLDIFTMQVAAAGLQKKWFQVTIADGFRSGLLTHKKKALHRKEPLTLAHFQFSFLIICIGNLLALISFVFEQSRRFTIHASVKLKKSKK